MYWMVWIADWIQQERTSKLQKLSKLRHTGEKELNDLPTGLYQAVQQVCNWSQSKKRKQDRKNISHNCSQIEVKPLSMDPGYLDIVLIPVKLKKKMNTTFRLIVKLLKTKDKK